MEKCTKCNAVVKIGKGYPMINGLIYCDTCYYYVRYRAKLKREEEKRQCQKK